MNQIVIDRIGALASRHEVPVRVHDENSAMVARDWMLERDIHVKIDDAITTDDATNIIKANYYSDVADRAQDLIARIQGGEFDDRDDFIEQFDQEIDGAPRVIYTHQAMLGVISSDNDEAYADEGMEIDCAESIPWSQIMYYAFRRDILEELDSEGVDVDDDDTFEEDEDDED